jgi:hypothetical protein
VKSLFRLLGWLLLPAALAGATSLEHARRAQAMLGGETWSEVIRVDNTAGPGAYPATVYALVFESAGILWFYTDTDGTQSFSRHPDRLAEEKADFSPLLREIDPGFTRWAVVPGLVEEMPAAGAGELPNGCFVESLAALRAQVRRGVPVARARLLSFYVDTPAGRRGHTVLTYETPRGLFLVDPGRSPAPRPMPSAWADNAPALANLLWPGVRVAQTRWVPTAVPTPPSFLAAVEADSDLAPGAAARLMR